MPELPFVILIAFSLVLSGCADTKTGAESDRDSIFHQQDGEREVHGEVGVMYGHTMR